jgi:hypothetical protein
MAARGLALFPDEVNWQTGNHYSKANQTVLRVATDGAENEATTRGNEKKGGEGMARHAQAPDM